MAGPYTHVWLARECLTGGAAQPDHEGDYLLGGTIADIIRLSLRDCSIPRHVTHLSLADFCTRVVQGGSSEAHSFLLGYLVHLVSDKVWHHLVYLDLLASGGDARYLNPRLTLLVDRALWLRTTPRQREHLSATLASSSDRGILGGAIAACTPESGVLANKEWAIGDWKNRLAASIVAGPQTLGLRVEDMEPIVVLPVEAPLMQAIGSFAERLLRLLRAELFPTTRWFQAALNAGEIPAGIVEELHHYDAAPVRFTPKDQALTRVILEGLIRL